MFIGITAKVVVQDYHIHRTTLSLWLYRIITFVVQDYYFDDETCTGISELFPQFKNSFLMEAITQAGIFCTGCLECLLSDNLRAKSVIFARKAGRLLKSFKMASI